MSEAGTVPGSAEGLTTEPGAVEALSTTASEPEADRGNYEARLRSDPEFALSEVKKWQAAKDRTESDYKAKLEKFSGLEPVVDFLGGSQNVIQNLGFLGSARSNPRMNALLEQFRTTGDVPGVGATDSPQSVPDEYLDPTERKVRELEGQLRTLSDQLSRGESRTAQDKFKGELTKFFENRPYLTNEERMVVLRNVDSQIQQWDQTPEGRRMIATLNEGAIKAIAGSAFIDRIEEIGERAYLRKQQTRAKAATEVATPRQANGQATSNVAKHAKDALREFMARNGLTEFRPDMGGRG